MSDDDQANPDARTAPEDASEAVSDAEPRAPAQVRADKLAELESVEEGRVPRARALPLVTGWLSDEDMTVRRFAARVSARFELEEIPVGGLVERIEDPTEDETVRVEIAATLGALLSLADSLGEREHPAAARARLTLLRLAGVRVGAAEALTTPAPASPSSVFDSLPAGLRRAVLVALGPEAGEDPVAGLVWALLASDGREDRQAGLEAAGRSGHSRWEGAVRAQLEDDAVRHLALRALGEIGAAGADEELAQALERGRERERREALAGLVALDTELARLALIKLAESEGDPLADEAWMALETASWCLAAARAAGAEEPSAESGTSEPASS